MKIAVDEEKCQGHARCFALAPDLFNVDDYGQSSVVGDGTVPPGREEVARLAIANCPELAIAEVEPRDSDASLRCRLDLRRLVHDTVMPTDRHGGVVPQD